MDNISLLDTFRELTTEDGKGYVPFKWQERLFNEFLVKGSIPEFVDIPTGLGKTSVMALWLIALAGGANLPKRLVYVVDRRAVVDQATRFAEKIRRNMSCELKRRLGLDSEYRELPISTLRGGFADNQEWLEDPSKPAIIVGTIDMVGSRLLFEGYGVSRGMRPYHAGFLGVDALIVLDESHLCPPFERLLRNIVSERKGKLGPRDPVMDPYDPPFCLMSLSATGGESSLPEEETIFRLDTRDFSEEIVRERIEADKRLKINKVANGEDLPRKLADCAVECCQGDSARVLVYCNSREDAISVKKVLTKSDQQILELLVGERRVYERQKVEKWLERYGFLDSEKSRSLGPAFLIATSAGEVGVDLDVDHIVCDLVAYERMVQRFGRLNRRGGAGRVGTVNVFAQYPKESKNPKESEIRERKSFQAQLKVLEQLPPHPSGGEWRNANFLGIQHVKQEFYKLVKAATTLAPLHPELTRPLLDVWSMTSTRQRVERPEAPEVVPWLRGWLQDEEPQSVIVWRKHLPIIKLGDDILVRDIIVDKFFKTAPVHAVEKLEARTSRIVDWLLKRVTRISKTSEKNITIIRPAEVIAMVLNHVGEHIKKVTLGELQAMKSTRAKENLGKILANQIIVVDSRMCGLSDGMLDSTSENEVVTSDSAECWHVSGDREDQEDQKVISTVNFCIQQVSNVGVDLRQVNENWRHVCMFDLDFDGDGIVCGQLAVFRRSGSVTDEEARSVLSKPQLLRDHAEQVARRAQALATRLNLPGEEITALTVAARLHDDGKAAECWQNAMKAPQDGRPYAKTTGGGDWRLLGGYRHEFGSLVMAEGDEELKKLSNGMRDLVLHLVAAHHGNARPYISFSGYTEGPPSLLQSKAKDAALRFVRLQNRYGPWGLAWREAILRSADQSVSREYSEKSCGGSKGG